MSGHTSPDGTDTDRPRPRTDWGSRASDAGSGRDRAVSELLGAILLFGLLIAVMVLLQANAVPSQNERIEFDHNQRVQGDVLELSSTAEDVAATGRDRSAIIELAPEYPNRFLLLNPGRAQGRITTSEADFTVENAVAAGETGDYWDGGAQSFDSNAIEYVPSYNVYQNAPDTKLAHGTVTDRFPDGALTTITDGSFVDGRRISLVALDGQRSEARSGALSVELVPLSTKTETVTVTSDAGDPLVITLQTDRTRNQWARILEPEIDDGFVESVDAGGPGEVKVVFEPGDYQLQLAKVGVGSGATDPDPAYLTARGNTAPTLEPGEERELTVQVRDGFNAPEPGVEVTFTETGEGSLDGTSVITDENGEATVTYTTGTADGTVTATIAGGTGGATDPRSVVYNMDLTTEDPGQGSRPGELNPGGSDSLQLNSASLRNCEQRESNKRIIDLYRATCRIDVDFTNTDRERTIDQVRIGVYTASQAYVVQQGDRPGGGVKCSNGQPCPRKRPTEWQFSTTTTFSGSYASVGGGYVNITDQTIPSTGAGSTPTYSFAFRVDSMRYNAMEGDFFVLTFEFDDGTTSSYVVSPQEP